MESNTTRKLPWEQKFVVQVLQDYSGKGKEVTMKIIHDLEDETSQDLR